MRVCVLLCLQLHRKKAKCEIKKNTQKQKEIFQNAISECTGY